MSLDDLVDRALAHGDAGDVELTQTVSGRPALSDGDGWISADYTVDLGRWR